MIINSNQSCFMLFIEFHLLICFFLFWFKVRKYTLVLALQFFLHIWKLQINVFQTNLRAPEKKPEKQQVSWSRSRADGDRSGINVVATTTPRPILEAHAVYSDFFVCRPCLLVFAKKSLQKISCPLSSYF